MRRMVALVICGATVGLAVPLLAQDMSEAEQRDWFVQFVEGQLSTPERQIRISNIDGALSSQASIREITISDEEGVWLRVNDAAIDWDQGALFTGRLLVRELSAASIDYLRNPQPSDAVQLPAPEANGFEVPEFPVAIQLDRIAVPSVTFGESVFGLGSQIALAGNLRLEGGSLDAALDIERLDGPGGRLDLDIAYANADQSIDLALTLAEPPDGILANLLNIEGRPAITLGVAGNGPVDDLTTSLTLDGGGQRALEGTASLAQAPGGLAVQASLGGPIGTLVAPSYRAFFGDRTALEATALVRSAGGIEVSDLQLSGGQLALAGSLSTTSDGFLDRLQLDGSIADPSGSVVLLPIPGGATSIQGAELSVDYGGTSGEDWTAALTATGFSNGDLSAQTLTVSASGVAANLADPASRRVTFNADGRLEGLSSPDAEVVAALGDSLGIGIAGLWNAGEPIQLPQLRIVGRSLTAALAGEIDDWTFNGQIGVATSSLAPFSGLADRDLGGALSLSATGSVSPLTGGFDLTLDGTAEDLDLAEPTLDRVLAGEVTLAGRVARNTQGFAADGFRLGNDRVQFSADGRFATGAADFDFAASLADLALLSNEAEGRLEITGSARSEQTIALELTGRVPQGRLAGKALADARFGFSGQLSPDGALAGALDGTASLDGAAISLAGDLASDETGRRLSGLKFSAGPTQLTGALAQDESGLITGELVLASPDISTAAALLALRASGAADATMAMAPAGGTQALQVTGDLSGLALDDLRVGSAAIEASIADLFGSPAISGTVAARDLVAGGFVIDQLDAEATQSGDTRFVADALLSSDPTLAGAGLTPLRASARGSLTGRVVTLDTITASGQGGLEVAGSGRVPLEGEGLSIAVTGTAPLALANRLVSDRGGQFSGTATLRAEVTGALASPDLSGSISTSGAGYVDPALNLRLVDISGSASLAGERLVIDTLAGRLATGGTVSVSGSVGLDGGNTADLALQLDQARYADGNLVVATLDGALRVTGELAGNSLISGNVRVERADITIPESFGGSAALVVPDHRNLPPDAAATLARARVDERSSRSGTAPRLGLDIAVAAPNQIFVRGRGLDAEVGGAVRLTGTLDAVQPVGAFSLNRGRLSILGQRITFEEGSLTLVGDLDPYLDFRARTEGQGTSVFVDVTGRVSDLDIAFSSNPPLPEDEVLSRLLFNRSMGELTPLQVARLAGAAAELAGGSNTSLVDSLRQQAGLADLDVTTGEDGSLAVQAGTYLQDNVYLGVEAGADGQSRATINLDLTEDIKARASTGTDGESSIGVFFETEY